MLADLPFGVTEGLCLLWEDSSRAGPFCFAVPRRGLLPGPTPVPDTTGVCPGNHCHPR